METQHGILGYNAVATVTLGGNYDDIEVLNRDGAAEIYFTIDGSTPTVGGTDCLVLPAAVGSLRLPSRSRAATVVRLTSALPVRYSVRGVEPWGSSPVVTQPTASDFPGLRLWFAADRITGLADGAPVATWVDASGSGLHASQAASAAQPLYKTNILNGKPVVRFDGVDDSFTTAAFPATFAQPTTIVAAVTFSLKASGNYYLTDGSASGTIRHALLRDSSNVWQMFSPSSSMTVSPASLPRTMVWSCQFNGANSLMRINGSTLATGNIGPLGLDGLTIGCRYNLLSTEFLKGDVAELAIYNNPIPTVAQLQVLEHAWGIKYGIPTV